MRNLQKEYFRTHTQSALKDSKDRERALDRKVEEIINGNNNSQLF